jgi:hypothetical protein
MSPRIFVLQALQLIDYAIKLHDTNRNLYDQAHYSRWCKQEIKKANLLLIAQILREQYLEEQRQGPVLPLLERPLSKRSISRLNIRSI